MPNHRRTLETKETEGAGPWQFQPDADLAAGDSILYDFRNMKYRKTKGFFKKYLPLDQAIVSNSDASNALDVTYNGVFDQRVLPNAQESFDQAGIARIEIRNAGSTAIPADDIVLEVLKDPYTADDAARERKNRSPVADVIEKFTGVGL